MVTRGPLPSLFSASPSQTVFSVVMEIFTIETNVRIVFYLFSVTKGGVWLTLITLTGSPHFAQCEKVPTHRKD